MTDPSPPEPSHPPAMRARMGRLSAAWYAAALSEELPAKRPIARTLLGEQIVLWRGQDGAAHAHLDRCLHRNALLSEGVILGDRLACPYHGWCYDPQGRCVEVPSLGPDRRPPADLQLPAYPVREQDGLIWLWMGAGPPDRDPFPMPHHAEPGWGSYYMKTRFANGVTHLAENFMDVPHTVFVHAGWFRSPTRRKVPTTVERTARPNATGEVCVTYHAPDDAIGFTDRILNPKGLPLTHTDRFFLPNTTRVDYLWGAPAAPERAFVITSTCTPVASDADTWVYTLISYKLGPLSGGLARLGRPLLHWYTRRVIQQDVEIMAIQGRAFAAHGAPAFHETEADRIHLHIEALRDWAAAGAPEPTPPPVREEIELWI